MKIRREVIELETEAGDSVEAISAVVYGPGEGQIALPAPKPHPRAPSPEGPGEGEIVQDERIDKPPWMGECEHPSWQDGQCTVCGAACTHHWQFESPNGGESRAACRRCGAVTTGANSPEAYNERLSARGRRPGICPRCDSGYRSREHKQCREEAGVAPIGSGS